MKQKAKKLALLLGITFTISIIMTGCTPDSSKTDVQGNQSSEKEPDDTQKGTAPDSDSSTDDSEKTEVSREDFPDCDGSGHGYIEIHYSDGSVEIEEY